MKRYIKEIVLFLQFQSQRGLPGVLPATIVHLCLYLLLLLGAQNVSTVSMAYMLLLSGFMGYCPNSRSL